MKMLDLLSIFDRHASTIQQKCVSAECRPELTGPAGGGQPGGETHTFLNGASASLLRSRQIGAPKGWHRYRLSPVALYVCLARQSFLLLKRQFYPSAGWYLIGGQ